MNRKVVLFFIVFSVFIGGWAQDSLPEKIAELEKKLPRASGEGKYAVLEELAELNLKIKPDRALEYGLQAAAAARELNDPVKEAFAANITAEAYSLLGKNDKALEIFQRSLQVFKKAGDRPREARVLRDIGTAYRRLSNYEKSLSCYRESLNISRELGSKPDIAVVLRQIGEIYSFLGDFDKALECHLDSLGLSEELGNERDIAVVRHSIGIVYLELDRYQEALEYFQKSLEFARKSGHKMGIAVTVLNIGIVYQNMNKFSEALEYFREGARIYEEIGARAQLSLVWLNIGQTYNMMKKSDKALEYLQKALKIEEETSNKRSLGTINSEMGYAALDTGAYDKAREYFEKALKIGDEIKLKHLSADAYSGLADTHAASGDYKKAFEYYQYFHHTEKEILNEESVNRVNELQARYEAEKKAKEMVVLKKENEIQGLRLSKVRFTRNAFICGFILVSIILGMLFKKYIHLFAFWKKQKYVGRFRLMDKVASGGMGTVYKAHALGDRGDIAAVKVLREELFDDEKNKKRFVREAAIIDKLEHPHIVNIFERGEVRHSLYIAMEFLEGQTLDARVKESRPPAIPEALHIMKQIAETVDFIHGQKIIHRDLKPANIMLVKKDGDPDYVKLLDFGAAKMEFQTRLTQSGNYVGTIEYIAPEQILYSESSPANDIFSMGVTFYFILAGHTPFPGETVIEVMRGIIGKEPGELSRVRPEVPGALRELIVEMLSKDPARRPAAAAIRERLEEIG